MNKHNLKNVQIFSLFTLTKIFTSVRIKKKWIKNQGSQVLMRKIMQNWSVYHYDFTISIRISNK